MFWEFEDGLTDTITGATKSAGEHFAGVAPGSRLPCVTVFDAGGRVAGGDRAPVMADVTGRQMVVQRIGPGWLPGAVPGGGRWVAPGRG
jgi:hypothetical protein